VSLLVLSLAPGSNDLAELSAYADGGRVSLVTAADLGRRGSLDRLRGHSALGLVGSPPEQELGFWLAPLVAFLARPKTVLSLDRATGSLRTESALRFVARAMPRASAQLLASGTAVVLQRTAAALLAGPARPRREAPAPELGRLVYLRPLVGQVGGVGGSVTHTHEVSRALRAVGVQVDPVTPDRAIAEIAASAAEPPARWRVVDIPWPLKAIPASAAVGNDLALAAAAYRSAQDADAVYQRHARFSLAGPLLARLTGKPLFLEYNGSEAFFGRAWQPTPLAGLLLACEDAALSAAARIIVVAEVEVDTLVARGIPADRIVVNPNGVDADRFARGGGEDLRRGLGIDNGTVVAGFVGSFGPWHGAPVLAEAFADVAAAVPELRLLLVGEGPELPVVRELLDAAGLTERVTFAGFVPPDQVPEYLDACDVLVSPHVPLPDGSEFFGSPTKLFEYMAAGKAILASSLGQIGHVLEDGKTGVLVTPGDRAELAAGLRRLAEAPSAARAELGANARRTAVERHSWRQNAERVLESYRSLTPAGS
jgi:glycosyltransferase involved in cell wall biosynthesis